MSASREGLAPSRTMSQSHLDDFNEFAQDDDEGVGTAWDDADVAQHDAMDEKMIPSAELLRNNPEELNALILLRMMTLNVLHPALRQGPEGEKTYWRGLVTRVWDILETESPSPLTLGANSGVGQDATMTQNSFQTSKMMKLLIREWIVCRLAWPCMDKICQPDYLNQRIAEKAQKRIMLQKTIRGFRTFLDSHFSNFPPSFVQSNADSAHTPASLTERSRFFEPLSKYSRKVRSGIDAKAIRHQIVSELRRRVDEAKDLQYYEELYGEPVEVLKRYVKSLDVLRAKYEKRISALTGEEMKSSDNTKRSPSANMFLRGDDPTGSKGGLTLRAMFDEYAKSVELGTERSTSLYYFLDYLEKRDDKRGMAKVRFWLAAEKYRKLVWRLMHGIVPSDAHPASNEPVSEHEGEVVGILMRLQKEAARIYHAFLAVQPGQSKPAVDIGNAILLSAIEEFATEAPSDLTRYSTLTELEESQDYKCVLVAQDMVYRELQDDFADFQHSESYFRWTSEEEKKKLTEADDASSGSGTVGGSLSEPYNVVQNRRSVDVMSRKSEEGVLASGNASFSAEFGEGGKGGEGFEVEVVQSTLLKLLLKEVENVAVRITGVKVIKAQSRAATSPTKSWFSRRESDLDSPMTPAFSFTIAAVDGSEVMTPDELSINQFATDTEEIHSARKDSFLDDESEYHAPGELLTTTTKLQQLKEEIDKVLLQIDCINLLNTFVQNERETAERNDKSNGSTNYLATVITHIFDQTKELLRQEVGDLTRQKAKYQSQEVKDAIVPGQCTVKIEAAFDDIVRRKDPTSVEGKKVTFYLIRIDKDLDMSGWTVRRRYSDFHALHRKLSQRFPVVQEFELPGKSLGIWPKGKKDLKYARMKSLEKYLQRLMDNPMVCQSEELRTFLSSTSPTLPSSLFAVTYRPPAEQSTADGASTSAMKRTQGKIAKFIASKGRKRANSQGPAMLLSLKNGDEEPTSKRFSVPALSSGSRRSTSDNLTVPTTPVTPPRPVHRATDPPRSVSPAPSVSSFSSASSSDSEPSIPSSAAPSPTRTTPSNNGNGNGHGMMEDDLLENQSSPLADPLYALLIECWDFKEQSFWLRWGAAGMLVSESLGWREGIDSRLASFLRNLISNDTLIFRIQQFVDKLCKKRCGEVAGDTVGEVASILQEYVVRPVSVQNATRTDARAKFVNAWPEAFARILGPESATDGTTRLFDMLQNATLNKHLVLNIIDAVVAELIGEGDK